MKNLINKKILFLFSIIIFSSTMLEAAPKVQTIVSNLEKNQVFNTAEIRSTLITQNRLGTTKNSFTSYKRKNGDTLLIINQGADKGQKILRKKNSIFLFYPEAEEIIRLQGSALKRSVMGSDFSYEDLTGKETLLERFNCVLLGTEKINNRLSYHLMMTAKSRTETYRQQEVWVDAQRFVAVKTILYSASGKALRELNCSKFKTISGHTIPFKMEMQDLLKKNSSTTIIIQNIKINKKINPNFFTREYLTW